MLSLDFNSMIPEILVGLILIALGWAGNKARLWYRSRSPLVLTIEQFAGDSWSVAFADKAPNLKDIDGIRLGPTKAYEKVLAAGAVDVQQTKIRVRIQCKSEFPVLIKDIVIDASKESPLADAYLSCPTAGSHQATALMVDFDDKPEPSKVWEAMEEDFEVKKIGNHPYFSHNLIVLNEKEYETIVIIGKTKSYHVKWTARLLYESNGKDGVIAIDLKGRPFQVTAEPSSGYAAKLQWAWYQGSRVIPEPVYED